ncbi:MAG: hypothetical protein ACRBN8_44850 [Nannocystales bacterium]
MPSQLHEVLAGLVREHPKLAVTLVERVLGVELGGPVEAHISSETLSEIEPAEYRADAVFELVRTGETKPMRALIVEVQLRPDPKKRLSWPMYQAGLRRRLQCPVLLMVVAPTTSVARWCAEPIDLDGLGGSVVRPLVVGPQNTPVVTAEAEAAQGPELAVLSVIAHGMGVNGASVGRAALSACASLDDERTRLYVDLIFLHLSDAARAALEGEMDVKKYEYQSEFARKYLVEGKAEGKAEAVVLVLRSRGFHVDEQVRTRLASLGVEELDEVLGRAVVVDSVDDLFPS